ncbi:speriolin-like protein [Bufo gargarizans]|uniref:speriolin-like protein n=1 Tax=Bufo gargarizans TaxID=30331 RepID=UPI001CF51542|nr:speriolin-like protein [Bufo gargarizans]
MELPSCYDTNLLKSENDNLKQQNIELRKILQLTQENAELRNILEKSSHNPDELQLCGVRTKHREEDSRYKMDSAKPSMDSHKQHKEETGHTEDSRSQPDGAKHAAIECGTHSPQNSHQLHLMQRIIGEIAFQLDRRILTNIFPHQGRLYGITVANIAQKITEASTDHESGKVVERKKAEMMQRYEDIMNLMKQYGYDVAVHPTFSENLVNVYGIMKEYPPSNSHEMRSLCDPANLKKIAYSAVPSSDLENVLILLKCLSKLSRRDGKPVFLH